MKQRPYQRVMAVLLLMAMLLTFCGCHQVQDLLHAVLGQKAEEAPRETTHSQPTEKIAPQFPEATQPPETEPTETVPRETEPRMYWVRAEGGLNVRSGPGLDYAILGNLPDGSCVFPERWHNGWAYISTPYAGWCSGDYLYDAPPEQEEDPAIFGTWSFATGEFEEDGLFHLCYNYIVTFNSDGTFHCDEAETRYLYNPDGTLNTVWGTGALGSSGTYTFDGRYLVITVTHSQADPGSPYMELDNPYVCRATVSFAPDEVMIFDWGDEEDRVYRKTDEALARQLMRELQK